MAISPPTSGQPLLDYILANREEIRDISEENVLVGARGLAHDEGIDGFRPLALSLEWSPPYMSFDISDHVFLRRHELPRGGMFALFVGPEGELRDGERARAKLRREIDGAIEDELASLREETDRLPPAVCQ